MSTEFSYKDLTIPLNTTLPLGNILGFVIISKHDHKTAELESRGLQKRTSMIISDDRSFLI